MRLRRHGAFFVGSFSGVLAAGLLQGEVIRSYSPSRHDRFVNFPSDLSLNAGFYLDGPEWTGVGFTPNDARKHFTLISPRHFVGARHFRPGVGQTIRFVNGSGQIRNFVVGGLVHFLNDSNQATDLSLGWLTGEVSESDGLAIAEVLNGVSEGSLSGDAIVLSGRYSRGGEGVIDGFTTINLDGVFEIEGFNPTRTFYSFYSARSGSGDDCHLEAGDSGGPTFAKVGGALKLIGIHTGIAETETPFGSNFYNIDTFIPHYLDELDEEMEVLGYHVKRTDLGTIGTTTQLSQLFPQAGSMNAEFTFSITSTGLDEVHNLQVGATVDGGASVVGVTGQDWVVKSASEVRRGGLIGGLSTDVVVEVDLPDVPTGDVTVSVSFEGDGLGEATAMSTVEVYESYATWAAGLSDATFVGDPDGDGVVNLIEYAVGRDGAV
ncbi:MAG: hypothetical protein AAGC74_14095, partial [Verrucomicrobiota bacterium]